MATVYIAPPPTGDDSRSYVQAQSSELPWATIERAIAGATIGDTIAVCPGNYVAAASPGYFNFTKRFLTQGLCCSEVRLTADPSHTIYVARTSAAVTAGNLEFSNLVVDGELRTENSLELGDQAGANTLSLISDCDIRNATITLLMLHQRRGSISVMNIDLSGSPSYGIQSGTVWGATASAPLDVVFDEIRFNLQRLSAAFIFGIDVRRADSPLSPVTCTVSNISGHITAHPDSYAYGVRLRGIDNTIIKNSSLLLNASSAVGTFGLQVVGTNSAATANNASVSGCSIRLDSRSGYGIILGNSMLDSFMSGGTVAGCAVQGTFYPEIYTPHGITLGRGTTGAVIGNRVESIFVGLMASMTETADIRSNLVIDCYGASLYAKGTTSAKFEANTIFVGANNPVWGNAVMCATYQGTTDCTEANFVNNLVVVFDNHPVLSLAQISQMRNNPAAAQPATFTNNTYIIPDTIDLDTAPLFTYLGAPGVPANQTYAQWLTNPGVSGDRIIQLPPEQIKRLFADAKNSPCNRLTAL